MMKNARVSPSISLVTMMAASFAVAHVAVAQESVAEEEPTARVVVTGEKVDINGNVGFGDGSADIDMESFDLLDEIAGALRDNPRFSRVRIEGHTDSRGDDLANMNLSQSRAEAVMRYLIRQGIDRKRMSPVGYGEEHPVQSNGSEKGRAKNRRVDVVVLEVDGQSITTEEPLAKVTAARNRVDARQPAQEAWTSAEVGLGLHRAWRVQSRERSAAEITFRDASMVQLRENTLVVIFGAVSKKAARRTTTTAQLERGTLRNRLAGLSGDKVAVTTPSSEVELQTGTSIISVDRKGKSMIANHSGKSAKVFGRRDGRRAKKSVKVKVGYGTTAEKGKDPTKPKKLPKPPAWVDAGPLRFLTLKGGAASVVGAFSPVDGAKRYAVELLQGADDKPNLLSSLEVPKTVTKFEFHGLPAGSYRVRVSTLDGDGLESVPSAALAVNIDEVTLPSGTKGAFVPPPSESGTPAVPKFLPGTEVAAPAGVVCQEGTGPFVETLSVAGPGRTQVRCRSATGTVFAPMLVDVIAPSVVVAPEVLAQGPVAPGAVVLIALDYLAPMALPVDEITAVVPAGIGTKPVHIIKPFDGRGGQLGVQIEIPGKYRGPIDIEVKRKAASLAKVNIPMQMDAQAPTVSDVDVRRDISGLIVTAKVEDNVSVKSATLHFREPGAPAFESVAMSEVVLPTMQGLIPGADRPVEYYIEADDALGNGPTSSGSAEAPLTYAPDVVVTETAESGLGFSRWWGAIPVGIAGVAGVAGCVFAASVGYGLFRANETQGRFDAGDVSATVNQDFQNQARFSIVVDAIVMGTLFVVAAGTGVAGASLLVLGE